MEKLLTIFDYMKISFKLNKNNRALYKPQIVLILLKGLFYVVIGVMLYDFIFSIDDFQSPIDIIFKFLFQIGGLSIASLFFYYIGVIIVESGLYNMYKSCIMKEKVYEGIFTDGVRKYFMKFLIIDILTMIAWIILFIPFIIISMITLLAGFVLIPLLASIFTSMWKVSIVMDECKIYQGLKNSFNFAKTYFVQVSCIVILSQAFSGLTSGGGLGNFNFPTGNSSSDLKPSTDDFNLPLSQWYTEAIEYLKIGFYILIPVVSIAVIISSFVKMVFKIFFELTLFVIYNANNNKQSPELTKEVL